MRHVIKFYFVFIIAIVLMTACSGSSGDEGTKPDTTAPGEATVTVTSAGGGNISLSWTEPADSDFDHVLITWEPDGTAGTAINAGTINYIITGLTNGTEYTITVKTVDTSDNMSTGESIKITPPSASVPVHYIYKAAELDAINDTTDSLDDYYILMADLDLSAYSNWTMIGDYTTAFSGTIDGNEHTISNLTINSTEVLNGLFGYAANAMIKNLSIEDVSITGGSYGYIGGIAGETEACTISNCQVTGSVSGDENIGGLIGYCDDSQINECSAAVTITGTGQGFGGLIGETSDSTVTNCFSTGSVFNDDDSRIGGLIGNAEDLTATGCYSTAAVTGESTAGGLIGRMSTGSIEDSYATGNVTAYGDNAGGLIGYCSGTTSTITGCYATGTVIGVGDTGGLIGECYNGNITDSFASGNITGTGNDIGGLVGVNYSGGARTFSGCYATGTVTSTGNNNIGGLIGYNRWAVENCFATGNVTGSDSIGGLIGNNYADTTAEASMCYAAGVVSGSSNYGGLVGQVGAGSTTDDCFYDSTVSGYDSDSGVGWTVAGTATSTADMNTQSTFTDAGWDFYGESANGTNDIWSISASINNGYPYLAELQP